MYTYVARGKTKFVSFDGKYRTIVVISAKSVWLHYGVDGRHTGKLNWLIVRIFMHDDTMVKRLK